ncbi:MAG TPA: diguanylate cyclase, partial [Gammaproteobacteria bacterium]|nr:diguanylate cyclase [Gammaproteobacteria bacterium]
IGPEGTFVGMARDVTERLQNQNRLSQRNQRLTQALSDLKDAHRELQSAREELERLAHYDSLTGVANRNLFLKQSDSAVRVAIREGSSVSLLMIDLDGFKEVNDTLGHAAGDAMLQEFALRLRRVLADTDLVYRLGGDEFAVLHRGRGKNAERDAVALAERIVSGLDAPMLIKGDDCFIRASVGIAVLPTHAKDANTLIRKADAAMYEVKRGTRDSKIQMASDLEATTVLRGLRPKPA